MNPRRLSLSACPSCRFALRQSDRLHRFFRWGTRAQQKFSASDNRRPNVVRMQADDHVGRPDVRRAEKAIVPRGMEHG